MTDHTFSAGVRARASAWRPSGFIARLALSGALVVAATAIVRVQSTSTQSAPSGAGATDKLSPSDAAAAARATRQSATVNVAEGLDLKVWAPEGLVADPMAIDIDPRGVVYITSSARSGMLMDIRQHDDWVPEVHTLKTVDDLQRFFRRVMAPERSAENTWLPDYNNDGTRDWRDLTVIKERIYRIEDTDNDGVADASLVAFEGFNQDVASDIAGGLLLHGADLYVAAAPDLWRLRDTNGDRVFDVSESISRGYSVHPAFSGHDMSGVTAGPDGRIYWKIGDIGLNVVDKTGKRWAHPNSGAIMRSEPDGSGFEVFAAGLRNTQEIAFDTHGNLISVDNDGDHQGETERVVYITQGSDAGWRSTWQYGKYTDPKNNRYNVWMDEQLFKPQFAGQAAYITPPLASYRSGPSGFAFNPGTAVGNGFRNSFFVTSFTGGAANARVFAFDLHEQGAGFTLANDRELVRGLLAAGMKIGPDGAIYLTDWVRGWGATGEGKIWKLDSPADAGNPMRAEVRALLNDDMAAKSTADLQMLLGHADMRVRLRAQFDLVRRQDVTTLTSVTKDASRPLARIHAIWGLGQLARTDKSRAGAIRPLLGDTDAEVRAQAAKALGDVRDAASADALVPMLADSAPRVRFFAAEAVGRIGARTAVPGIVRMLAENNDADVHLRSAGVNALAAIGDSQALTALTAHASRGARLAAVVALRRMRDAGVARFLDDADPLVVLEAARAINDEGGIPAALPALARVVDRPGGSEPLTRRALSANLRVGDGAAAARVGAYALRRTSPAPLRVEAVQILGVWGSPSTMDRVDGEYLGPQAQTRDTAGAVQALTQLLPLLDAPDSSAALKVATIEAVSRLGIKQATPVLVARLRQDGAAPVRVAALRALQAIGGTQADEAIRLALADADASVRMTAIGAMETMPLPDAAKVAHLRGLVASQTASVGEKQSAIGVLGKLSSPAARTEVDALVASLNAGSLPSALQLDVIEAAQKTSSSVAKLARVQKATPSPDQPALLYPEALATGGSVTAGRQVVMQHPAAQCVRCHTVAGGTANVGPPLTGIGSRMSRAEIVQSLLDPNARIAPGFGVVSLTLKSGEKIDGVLKAETPASLTIALEKGERIVPTAQIATRSAAASAMPPMGALLQPRQIRDVVEFLATQ